MRQLGQIMRRHRHNDSAYHASDNVLCVGGMRVKLVFDRNHEGNRYGETYEAATESEA